MPVRDNRQQDTKKPTTKSRHENLIDLSFLPEVYINRIDAIFDSYFNLGMKRRYDRIEEDAPIFPSKVSSISSPELGDTLSKYTAWFSYASDKHKYVVVATNHIEEEMRKVFDKEMGKLLLEKGNIDSKKSKAKDNEEYQSLMTYHQKLIGLKTLLDGELNNYEACIASLSREISRREHHGGF